MTWSSGVRSGENLYVVGDGDDDEEEDEDEDAVGEDDISRSNV